MTVGSHTPTSTISMDLPDIFASAIDPRAGNRANKIPLEAILEEPESYDQALKVLSRPEPGLDVGMMEKLFDVVRQINIDLALYLGEIWIDRKEGKSTSGEAKLALAERESKALNLYEKLFHHWQDAKKIPAVNINGYWKKLNAHFLEIAGRLCTFLGDGKSPYESIKVPNKRDPVVIREEVRRNFDIPTVDLAV